MEHRFHPYSKAPSSSKSNRRHSSNTQRCFQESIQQGQLRGSPCVRVPIKKAEEKPTLPFQRKPNERRKQSSVIQISSSEKHYGKLVTNYNPYACTPPIKKEEFEPLAFEAYKNALLSPANPQEDKKCTQNSTFLKKLKLDSFDCFSAFDVQSPIATSPLSSILHSSDVDLRGRAKASMTPTKVKSRRGQKSMFFKKKLLATGTETEPKYSHSGASTCASKTSTMNRRPKLSMKLRSPSHFKLKLRSN